MPTARVRGDLTVFERRERDGIDYYRDLAHRHLARAEYPEPEFHRRGSRCACAVASQTFDFRYTGLRGTQDTIAARLHQVHLQLPDHSAVLAWQGDARRAALVVARGSACSTAAPATRTRYGIFTPPLAAAGCIPFSRCEYHLDVLSGDPGVRCRVGR